MLQGGGSVQTSSDWTAKYCSHVAWISRSEHKHITSVTSLCEPCEGQATWVSHRLVAQRSCECHITDQTAVDAVAGRIGKQAGEKSSLASCIP